MYCTKCGKKIDDDLRFCNYCGAPVEEESNGTAPEQKTEAPKSTAVPKSEKPKKKSKAPVVITIIVILIVVFWFIGFMANKKVHTGLTIPTGNGQNIEIEPTGQNGTLEIPADEEDVFGTPTDEERASDLAAGLDEATAEEAETEDTESDDKIYNFHGSTYGAILYENLLTYGPIQLELFDGYVPNDENSIKYEDISDPAFIYVDTNEWDNIDFAMIDGDEMLAIFEENLGQSAELVSFDKWMLDGYPVIEYSTKFMSEQTGTDVYVSEIIVFETPEATNAVRIYSMSASAERNFELTEMFRGIWVCPEETTSEDTGFEAGNEAKISIK